jgi:hypothetical protein
MTTGWGMVVPPPFFAAAARGGTCAVGGVAGDWCTLDGWNERSGTKEAEVTEEPGEAGQVRVTSGARDHG